MASSAPADPGAPAWLEPARVFFSALMFLTRIPVPAWVGHSPERLARSTVFFPVIGAVVGGAGAAVFWAAHLVWPAALAVVLSTTATVWLTGAFHEDALADACDGFGGGWERDRVLAIMKDSRIGSYGAAGLILVLAAKLAALTALAPGDVVRGLVAAHVLGRWSSLPLIWGYPYVREGSEATGKPFAASVTPARLMIGSLLGLGIVAAVLGLRALPAILVAMAVTALAGRYFRRRIGGITGDCLGAANQVVELATYLVLAFRWPT